MNTVHGDLLQLAIDGEFDVIVHGCNCYCIMGAGIAAQIRSWFPSACAADCETTIGDLSKLGTYSEAEIISSDYKFSMLNAYTQGNTHGSAVLADYSAIDRVFESIADNFKGRSIGYPMIGAGLAGGDWSVISKIINKRLYGLNHTLVVWDKS